MSELEINWDRVYEYLPTELMLWHIALMILIVYFIPTLVSLFRNSKSGFGILFLNLFLGWTLIGWIAAFIWAFTAKTVKEYNIIYNQDKQ